MWKIPNIPKLKNSKNYQFGKFRKFAILQICNLQNSKNWLFVDSQKFSIWKISKISNLENSKSFRNFTILKIIRFLQQFDFEKQDILKIVRRQKIAHFQNFTIWKTRNSVNFQFLKLSYILSVHIIQTNIKTKNKFENKKQNNSFFVILIFEISKF